MGWISDLTAAIRTGYFHLAFLAVSLLWTAAGLYRSRNTKTARADLKASRIHKRYEIPSQAARIAALAFTLVAAVRGDYQLWHSAALVGCAVLLGLTRLANNLQWRHIALHQVNFLIAVSLLLLAAAELLPVLELNSAYRPAGAVVGALVSLAAATLVALWTPREWSPPPVSVDLLQRAADAGPAPEEICSWWTKLLTYEWLTPIIWKGEPPKPNVHLSCDPAC